MRENNGIEAYPLCWPTHVQRAKHQDYARFKTTFAAARDGLIHELDLMGASDLIISTNIPLKNDGFPYANYKNPDDPGVAVYFNLDGVAQCFPCDKWEKIADNIHAINKTVGALRGIERWGGHDMVRAAFTGFKAIPESVSDRQWWDVLQVSRFHSLPVIESKYKLLSFECHPDHGGSQEAMAELNQAMSQARESINRR